MTAQEAIIEVASWWGRTVVTIPMIDKIVLFIRQQESDLASLRNDNRIEHGGHVATQRELAKAEAENERLRKRIANAVSEINNTPTHNGGVLRWANLYKRLMQALAGGKENHVKIKSEERR